MPRVEPLVHVLVVVVLVLLVAAAAGLVVGAARALAARRAQLPAVPVAVPVPRGRARARRRRLLQAHRVRGPEGGHVLAARVVVARGARRRRAQLAQVGAAVARVWSKQKDRVGGLDVR